MVDAHVLERTRPFKGLGYSPARTMMGDHTGERELSRETILASLRLRILAAARRRLSPADAEDLTQEVLLLLRPPSTPRWKTPANSWRSGSGYSGRNGPTSGASPPGEARRPRRTPRPCPCPTGVPGLTPWPPTANGCAYSPMQRPRLDGRCREILRRKLEGLSFVEIAAEFRRPVNTVYSWDFRCHQRLRKLLGDRWGFVAGQEGR